MGRDSILGTLLVAVVLCVVCSVLVSAAAVFLSPRQEANKALYEKTNILMAAGLIRPSGSSAAEDGSAVPEIGSLKAAEVEQLFGERVRKVLVDLDNAAIVPEDEVNYEEYDPKDAANDPKRSKEIAVSPSPGIDRRANMQFLYEVLADGSESQIEQYVLPVYGKGLWSTLYGFLAVNSDGETIKGITFYEHGETPGLGGEVENSTWQAKWDGKLAYDEQGDVIIQVVKGSATADNAEWTVDGLSGATITTKGVSNFVQYWLGSDGFGPFLKKQTGNTTGA